MKKYFKAPQNLLTGAAGVHRVTSEVMLRGLNVLFPAADHGADLILENGHRLQVKARKASRIIWRDKSDPVVALAYHFRIGKKRYNPTRGWIYKKNKFTDEVDFFIFWGIDENRFFIIPSEVFASNSQSHVVIHKLDVTLQKSPAASFRRTMLEYEGRWDLLAKPAAESFIDSADNESVDAAESTPSLLPN